MKIIARVLLIWGVIDALVLAVRPKAWRGIWSPVMDKLSQNHYASVGVGAVELLVCAWLLRKF